MANAGSSFQRLQILHFGFELLAFGMGIMQVQNRRQGVCLHRLLCKKHPFQAAGFPGTLAREGEGDLILTATEARVIQE